MRCQGNRLGPAHILVASIEKNVKLPWLARMRPANPALPQTSSSCLLSKDAVAMEGWLWSTCSKVESGPQVPSWTAGRVKHDRSIGIKYRILPGCQLRRVRGLNAASMGWAIFIKARSACRSISMGRTPRITSALPSVKLELAKP